MSKELPERYRVCSINPTLDELHTYLFDSNEDIFVLNLAKSIADADFADTGIPHVVWALHKKLAVIVYRSE